MCAWFVLVQTLQALKLHIPNPPIILSLFYSRSTTFGLVMLRGQRLAKPSRRFRGSCLFLAFCTLTRTHFVCRFARCFGFMSRTVCGFELFVLAHFNPTPVILFCVLGCAGDSTVCVYRTVVFFFRGIVAGFHVFDFFRLLAVFLTNISSHGSGRTACRPIFSIFDLTRASPLFFHLASRFTSRDFTR